MILTNEPSPGGSTASGNASWSVAERSSRDRAAEAGMGASRGVDFLSQSSSSSAQDGERQQQDQEGMGAETEALRSPDAAAERELAAKVAILRKAIGSSASAHGELFGSGSHISVHSERHSQAVRRHAPVESPRRWLFHACRLVLHPDAPSDLPFEENRGEGSEIHCEGKRAS